MYIFFWILCFIFWGSSPLFSASIENEISTEEINPFFVLTIPKSGTHLMVKLLSMVAKMDYELIIPQPMKYGMIFINAEIPPDLRPLLKQKSIEEKLMSWHLERKYSLAHFNMYKKFSKFSSNHPNYKKIIEIRDLRDACVSCAYHSSEWIESMIGPCSIEEKIMFVLTAKGKQMSIPVFEMEEYARLAVKWLKKHPDSIVFRFENLIGPQGGGKKSDQVKEIKKLADALGIQLHPENIEYITENLFGNKKDTQISVTFREGMIGSWKTHFTQEHQRVFEENFGHLQKALGYPIK